MKMLFPTKHSNIVIPKSMVTLTLYENISTPNKYILLYVKDYSNKVAIKTCLFQREKSGFVRLWN